MEKGVKLRISNDAEYLGQNMGWTEERTGFVKLGIGDKLYHHSRSHLDAFFPKVTCFHDTYISKPGHIYCFIAKREIEVDVFSNEYRVDLSAHADDFDVYYIGTTKYTPVRNENGFVIKTGFTYDLLEEFM